MKKKSKRPTLAQWKKKGAKVASSAAAEARVDAGKIRHAIENGTVIRRNRVHTVLNR